MDMRRINARNYAVYLQRRVEDHFDADRPTPKWAESDRRRQSEKSSVSFGVWSATTIWLPSVSRLTVWPLPRSLTTRSSPGNPPG